LVSIDGVPFTDAATILNDKKVGDKITVNVLRDGLPLTLQVTLLRNNRLKYKVESLPDATPQQLEVRKKWLKL
jgi:predicted metalloprotease with PDZ domain